MSGSILFIFFVAHYAYLCTKEISSCFKLLNAKLCKNDTKLDENLASPISQWSPKIQHAIQYISILETFAKISTLHASVVKQHLQVEAWFISR